MIGLNPGLTLSTYTSVEPTPTDLIIYAVGKIFGSYRERDLSTIFPLISLSSLCPHQFIGLSAISFFPYHKINQD